MAQQDSAQEKTEQATQKKIQKARDKGQIPRSRELASFSMLVVAGLYFYFQGPDVIEGMVAFIKISFQIDRQEIFEPAFVFSRFLGTVQAALMVLVPFFSLMVLVAILSSMALGGIAFSFESLQPKLEKLDPIKGMKKLFSSRGLMELIKALIKFVLVVGTLAAILYYSAAEIIALGRASTVTAIKEVGEMVIENFILLSLMLLWLVVLDVPFQLYDHSKKLRMSKQEVKDEMKDTEGKPEVKGHIRAMQREIAKRRMMAEVATADVVITNPSHFACALKYDQKSMLAPKLVAKGADLLAMQIRDQAKIYSVAIVAAPPLARAIYYNTELEGEIPAGLYLAVAQVLAYVYQVQEGLRSTDSALDLNDIEIPDNLRR